MDDEFVGVLVIEFVFWFYFFGFVEFDEMDFDLNVEVAEGVGEGNGGGRVVVGFGEDVVEEIVVFGGCVFVDFVEEDSVDDLFYFGERVKVLEIGFFDGFDTVGFEESNDFFLFG